MSFVFVSANLALDFAGTVKRRRADRIELLERPGDLAHWAVSSGVVDVAPGVTSAAFRQAVELREAIYRLAHLASTGATESPRHVADREHLNTVALGRPVRIQLDARQALAREGGIGQILSTVARSGIELLGGPQRDSIKECGATHCTRLYVDTSARSVRRWCDMTRCGNRAKAAAFRARQG